MRTSTNFTCDSWCVVFDLEGECEESQRESQREREEKVEICGFKLDRMTIQSNIYTLWRARCDTLGSPGFRDRSLWGSFSTECNTPVGGLRQGSRFPTACPDCRRGAGPGERNGSSRG